MDGKLSNEVRFRAKVNDHVPPNELLAWADRIEAMEQALEIAQDMTEDHIRERLHAGLEKTLGHPVEIDWEEKA